LRESKPSIDRSGKQRTHLTLEEKREGKKQQNLQQTPIQKEPPPPPTNLDPQLGLHR